MTSENCCGEDNENCGEREDCKCSPLEQAEIDHGIVWKNVSVTVCLGHLVPQIGKCYVCKSDDQNETCEAYRPSRQGRYVVWGEES